MTATPLGVGVLGAARITGPALVDPAHELGTRLVAIAARDRTRAEAAAAEQGFEHVLDSYQEVIDHPDVEVLYNPLPNSLHAPWNLAAIRAGKHVLTEKPFTGNALEAREVRDAAGAAGVHVIEAFHHRYHPLMARMTELALGAAGRGGGAPIGDLQYVEVRMMMGHPAPGDLRWDIDLAGGGLMDVGCYAVQVVRDLSGRLGGEPELVAVRAGEDPAHPGIDAWMTLDLRLPSGVPVHIESSMTHAEIESSLRLVGSRGEAMAPSYNKPQLDDRIVFTLGDGRHEEHLGRRASYTYQLEAFTELVRNGTPMHTDAEDAVLSMELIDEAYRACGMAPRPSAP